MTGCHRCDHTGVIHYGSHPVQCSNCISVHKYAGIGSRDTPEPVLAQMQIIGMQLAARGWILRSGRAKGADTAFEKGCDIVNPRAKVIRRATGSGKALEHAEQFHPTWGNLTERQQCLIASNSLIMLGDWLDDPVSFVVCWSDGECEITNAGINLATVHGIPVWNLAVHSPEQFWGWLNGDT